MTDIKLSQGAIYTFPISESEFGACRIVESFPADSDISKDHYLNKNNEMCFLVVTTTWIGTKTPDLKDKALTERLVLNHHSWKNQEYDWIVNGLPPENFTYIGSVTFEDDIQNYNKSGWGNWQVIGRGEQLLLQREWDNGDHEEILAREAAEWQLQYEEKKRIEAERIARLQGLSLEEYKKLNPFNKWIEFVRPKVAVKKSNDLFKETLTNIIALGEKPKKPLVMKELKSMITGFNELQKKYKFIETPERDDICVQLGDMLHLLKLKDDPALLFEKWEDL